MTEAVTVGLDRWLDEIEERMGALAAAEPAARFRRANEVVEATRLRHAGLASNFIAALAKAQHDPRVRKTLTAGFRARARTSPRSSAWATTRRARTRAGWSSPSSFYLYVQVLLIEVKIFNILHSNLIR